MARLRSVPTFAALLASLALTCAVAQAQDDPPPAKRGRLGLAIAQLDESWRESNSYRAAGVLVIGVDPRGRAANSGIVAGDVLVSVGGRSIRQPSDLGQAERSLSPDKAVSVALAREGGRLIKVFEIPPVAAVPVVTAGPQAAAAAPVATAGPQAATNSSSVAPSSAPATVLEPSAAPDSASDVAAKAAESDSIWSPPATSDSVATPAAAGVPAAAGAAILVSGATASPSPATSGAAPSVTGAGSAVAPIAGTTGAASAGSAGSTSDAGGASGAPVAVAAGAAVAGAAIVSTGDSPEPERAPEGAAADSGNVSPESTESVPADLGVVGRSLTPDLATALGAAGAEGVVVLEFTAASQAERAGLRAGDIILKVGDQPVADMDEFQRAVAASSSPVRVSTLRLGKARLEEVSLEGPPPTPSAPPSQEQMMLELRDEVRSLRREVQSLRKKLGK